MQAGTLFAAGRSQAQVARKLGVARQNVSRWHARWQAGGLEALRSAGPAGHAPRLSDQQLHRIDQALRQGARAHGFDTDHWTLARVTTVIEQLTGVSYHPGHTWKPLPAYAPELNPVEPLWSNLKGWSWPTSPATPSTTSSRRPSVACSASATPTICPSRSCATAACPSGERAFGKVLGPWVVAWPGVSSRSSQRPDEHRP
jgi:transposase